MPLPVVSGSEVQTPIGGTKMDSSAFRQAALAPGQIAAAIGQDVGGLFEDVSRKIQENRNARQVFDADLTMRKTKDEFTAKLATMPDEGTWLPAWQEQVKSVRQNIINQPHVGPEVKRILEQKFDVWEAATSAEVRTQALRKGVQQSREAAITDSTYAAHQGDLEGAQNILGAAVAHHAMSEADARKIAARFPTVAAQAQADTAISTNPIDAPELIKKFEGVMEPRVYLAVKSRAESERARAQSANLADFAEQMDLSPDGTVDPKSLRQAVKEGKITQRGADGLLTRMKKQDMEKSKDDFAVGMMRADDTEWTNDKKPEETAREIKDEYSHLPPALRQRLYKHIDKLMATAKQQGEKEEKPVQRDIFERGKQAFAQGVFRPGIEEDVKHLFGKDEKKVTLPVPKHGWESAVSDDERRIATLGYARWQDKMRDFFKANPEATSEQAQTYSDDLMKPHIMRMVGNALVPVTPVSEPNKAIDALLKKYGQ